MKSKNEKLFAVLRKMQNWLFYEVKDELNAGEPPHVNWMTFPINCMEPLFVKMVELEDDKFKKDVGTVIKEIREGWITIGNKYIEDRENEDMDNEIVDGFIKNYTKQLLKFLAINDLIDILDYKIA